MDSLEFLQEYWGLLTAFVAVISFLVTLRVQNNDQEKRLSAVEKKVEELNPIWIEIKERLVAIETTLKLLTKKD